MPSTPDRSGNEPIHQQESRNTQERRNAIHSRQERRNAIYISGRDHASIFAANSAGRERRNESDACEHYGLSQTSTDEAAVASVQHSAQFSVVQQSAASVWHSEQFYVFRQSDAESVSDDAAATTSGTTSTAPVAAQNPARNVHPAASTTCNTAAVARNTTTAAEDDSSCAAEASGFGRYKFGADPSEMNRIAVNKKVQDEYATAEDFDRLIHMG
jgi:hypothetical protein